MKRHKRARHDFKYSNHKNFRFITRCGLDDVWRFTNGDWYIVKISGKYSVWTIDSLSAVEKIFRNDRRFVKDYRIDTVRFFNFLIARGQAPFDGAYWRGKTL